MTGVALLAIILGYLLGSIPSAYIAGKVLKGIDIREVGNRNMGAQNAFREIGAKAGISVGIVDVSKGAIAVLIALGVDSAQLTVFLTGLAAVVAHNWPPFLGFRGGRGEATTLGILLILLPREMLILSAAAAVPFFITCNVTLSSAILFAPLPFLAWWLGTPLPLVAYSIALPSLVGFTHFIRTRNRPTNGRDKATHAN